MFEWYYVFIYIVFLQFLGGGVVFSIWIHRINDHRMLDATKPFEWFCRVYTWMLGFYTPNFLRGLAAQHVKHHKFADREGDPHSPWIHSPYDIIFKKLKDPPGGYGGLTKEEIEHYCPAGVPKFDDWFDRFAWRYRYLGWVLLMSTFFFFGIYGFMIGMIYSFIGQFAPVIHHVVSHKYGYRHRPARQTNRSRNFYPIGTLMYWGEELHANHHDNWPKINFGEKWWEIDVMYYVIRILLFFKLLKERQQSTDM